MRHIVSFVIVALAFAANVFTVSATDNYVRISGTKLIGRDGQTLVMRGTNCGNWMVREPYMMNTSGNLDRQFKFDQMLADVCGEEKVEEFDRLYEVPRRTRLQHLTRTDALQILHPAH